MIQLRNRFRLPLKACDEVLDLPREILDRLLGGCQVISADFRYLYVNETLLKQGKKAREELLGRTMMECHPGIEQTPMFSHLTSCLRGREPARFENEFHFPNGAKGWFELRMEPVPQGVAIFSVDITERKRAQATLDRIMRKQPWTGSCVH